MCSARGEGKSSEGSERGRRVKGALFSPLVPRWDTQAPRSCGPARVAYLLLPRRGEPKRGAASRASEASRLASTWAAEKFAQTPASAWQLRIPATAASSKCADGPLGWRRLAGPRRPQPLGCCVPAGECNPRARGTPAFTPWVPVQWAVSRALTTATSQLSFLPFQAVGDRTLTRGRRDVASALSDGDAARLRLGMLLYVGGAVVQGISVKAASELLGPKARNTRVSLRS